MKNIYDLFINRAQIIGERQNNLQINPILTKQIMTKNRELLFDNFILNKKACQTIKN